MRLAFCKMHGQGNDFVMLNGISQPHASQLTPAQIRFLADRHFGIGCDQVLLVEAATRPDADFRYRIFNASGEEVEHCGNGARCFPVFVRDEGLTTKTTLNVQTINGLIKPTIHPDERVSVDMGLPRFEPIEIPFLADTTQTKYSLKLLGVIREVGVVSMGNPHAVQLVKNVMQASVASEGFAIEHHPQFPQRVNAGFMEVVSPTHIRLRVWERGAGETLACGTGACAAVVTGIRWGLLDETVEVDTNGGRLSVTWQGAKNQYAPVTLTGSAVTVYRGEITI